MAKPVADLPTLQFESQAAWETWLEKNQGVSQGVWLQLAKKGSGIPSVTYAEAVESALCYGWIDGQAKSLDETFYRQKYTPRRKQSIWSKINRERAEELIRLGRMQPAGLREIERAKEDGRWEAAYDSPRNASVPEDFQAELDKNQKAQVFFDSLNSTNRYAILFRIQTAKKPETRLRRIEKIIHMLENEEKLYP